MNTYNISFKSGLNNQLLQKCQHTRVSGVESVLLSNGIHSNLDNSIPIAFSLQKILEIFNILKQKTGSMLFQLTTPQIRTYLTRDLETPLNDGYGFCIPETQKVLKSEPLFATGAIFYQKEDSLDYLDTKLNESYKKNQRSSSHYLSPFIHEIMHSIYVNLIYTKHGYEGDCPYTKQRYPHKSPCGLKIMQRLTNLSLSDKENNLIREQIGNYAAMPQNQYHEVFAEALTKIICDCLSNKDSMPIKNPFEELQKYPIEFLKILQKILSI